MAPAHDEDEEPVEGEVEYQREDADHHRQPAFVDGIEGGLQNLEPCVAEQAVGVGAQRGGGLQAILCVEGAALVEQAHDGVG